MQFNKPIRTGKDISRTFYHIIIMNTLDFTYQTTMIGSSSSPLPPPSTSLASSYCDESSSADIPYELECSKFDTMTPSYPSLASFNSLSSDISQDYPSRRPQVESGMIKGFGSTLSRSRCVHNLSSLGSVSSFERNTRCTSSIPKYGSGPNEGYGYFVDTPSK